MKIIFPLLLSNLLMINCFTSSILNVIIYYRHREYKNAMGDCLFQYQINTTDQGYLVGGFISFRLNSSFPFLVIIKYSQNNEIQFKIFTEIQHQIYSIHRIQELESFYHILIKDKILIQIIHFG